MARALLGYATNPSQQILVTEVARLRARVRELEAEVAELRALHASGVCADHAEIDLELHQMTQDTVLA
jgi:hypothetical protein